MCAISATRIRSISLFADIGRHFPQIDVLINNAGLAQPNAHIDQTFAGNWRAAIDTNLTGAFLCTRAALPLMRRGSTIVNNVSIAATTLFAGMAAYSASKAGLLSFTNTLREEMRARGIRVIAFTPGRDEHGYLETVLERGSAGKDDGCGERRGCTGGGALSAGQRNRAGSRDHSDGRSAVT